MGERLRDGGTLVCVAVNAYLDTLLSVNPLSADAELRILVAWRFVVTIEGSDVDMTFLNEAARSIDLSTLASMKNAGIAS